MCSWLAFLTAFDPHFRLHLQVEIEVQSEEISALSRAREADEMETRKALQEKEQSFIEMEAQFNSLKQGLLKNISLTSQNLLIALDFK